MSKHARSGLVLRAPLEMGGYAIASRKVWCGIETALFYRIPRREDNGTQCRNTDVRDHSPLRLPVTSQD